MSDDANPASGPRQINDAKALSALAHPLRHRMLDILKVDGPATASVLAQRTGQAVGNASHHLKVLAECSLVEEAPELARDRRERWWRVPVGRIRWSSKDFPDAADQVVALAAESLNLDHQLAVIHAWRQASEQAQAAWPTGPFSTDTWIRASDAELAQISDEVIAVLTRWADREIPDDGVERDTVFVFARGVPGTP